MLKSDSAPTQNIQFRALAELTVEEHFWNDLAEKIAYLDGDPQAPVTVTMTLADSRYLLREAGKRIEALRRQMTVAWDRSGGQA